MIYQILSKNAWNKKDDISGYAASPLNLFI